MNAPALGEPAEVALIGGGALLKLDEAVIAGQYITSSTASQGEKVDAAGEHCAAIADEAGADGDVIAVQVTGFSAVAAEA